MIRYFQKELFSRFLPSTYAGHVGHAPLKPWLFMPKWKDGSTVELIIFRVQDFLSAYYRVNYFDKYYCKVMQWDIILDIA